MSQEIFLAAMLVRDGRLLVRDAGGRFELPGGRLLPEHHDAEAGLSAILGSMGIDAQAQEDDLLETLYLPAGSQHVVYNLYAPASWEGEPSAGHWLELEAIEQAPLDPLVQGAVLQALGMATREGGTAGRFRDALPRFVGGDPAAREGASMEKFVAHVATRFYRVAGVELVLVPLLDEASAFTRSAGDGYFLVTLVGEPGSSYPLDLRSSGSLDPDYLGKKFRLDRRGYGYTPEELAAALSEVAADLAREEALEG